MLQVDSVETVRSRKNVYKLCWLLVFVDVWGEKTLHVILDGAISDQNFLALNTEKMISMQNLKVEPRSQPLPIGAALRDSGFIEISEIDELIDIAR